MKAETLFFARRAGRNAELLDQALAAGEDSSRAGRGG